MNLLENVVQILHQPLDVCMFAPTKRQLFGKWSHWDLFEDKTYTVHTNALTWVYHSYSMDVGDMARF